MLQWYLTASKKIQCISSLRERELLWSLKLKRSGKKKKWSFFSFIAIYPNPMGVGRNKEPFGNRGKVITTLKKKTLHTLKSPSFCRLFLIYRTTSNVCICMWIATVCVELEFPRIRPQNKNFNANNWLERWTREAGQRRNAVQGAWASSILLCVTDPSHPAGNFGEPAEGKPQRHLNEGDCSSSS